MSDWWEKGYPGGPMVAVRGFPRPLYPPDASKHGKKPSADGPDIVAYKRTVSRAGRWPWQTFDDSYSNSFAHGSSGNVRDTGMAGVQRQGDLDDTGWVGKNTFNLLRSIRIPEGLDHAGEPAMDQTAINLINQAYDLFEGKEPVPDQGGTVRQAALNRAVSQLGITESPPDSNQVKYCSWYGMVGPWCAMFCTWCYELGAKDVKEDSPTFIQGSRYAYVPYIVGDARGARYGLKTVDPDQVMPGDLVCYDWGWDGTYDHVGLFEKWTSGLSVFNAIEGNTSVDNDSNGGEVMRRTRNVSGQSTVFCRVTEP